jgi:hypothetical protein
VGLGANPTFTATLGYGGNNSLQVIAQSNANHAASAEIAKLFLDLDGDLVNSPDRYGFSPLRISCSRSNLPLSTVLLERGALPNLENNDGVSAVHLACFYGPLELVLLLIRHGANIHLKNSGGDTPLTLCDRGTVRLNSHAVERAFFYAPAQNWLRRASFAVFRSAIYGSPAFHAWQMLLPEEERQEAVVVKSTDMRVWKIFDQVFGNTDLCREISKYL